MRRGYKDSVATWFAHLESGMDADMRPVLVSRTRVVMPLVTASGVRQESATTYELQSLGTKAPGNASRACDSTCPTLVSS